MKKVLAGVAIAGMIVGASASEIGVNDAQFMFGHNDVNVVAMSGMEMAQTEGQLLELLPIVGPLLGSLVSALPVLVASAFPIDLNLDLALGALLDTKGTQIHIESGLPTLLGAIPSLL